MPTNGIGKNSFSLLRLFGPIVKAQLTGLPGRHAAAVRKAR